MNFTEITDNLTLGGIPVARGLAAQSFGRHFCDKIRCNIKKAKVDINGIYNGKNKLIVLPRNFMSIKDVEKCMSDLNSKTCEGFDRIPVCAIYDARATLLSPMTALFGKIYNTSTIPEQWKVAKIILIFKKGNKNEIENYRPIANLCSASKILEKLILKQIHYLETTNKLDLTGKRQHGFKRSKSTATAGALLQSMNE